MCLPEELDTWNRNNRHREQIIGVGGSGDQNNNGAPGNSPGGDDGANGYASDEAAMGGLNQANANLGIKSVDLIGEAKSVFGKNNTAPPSNVPGLPSRSTPAPAPAPVPAPEEDMDRKDNLGIDSRMNSRESSPAPSYGGQADPQGPAGAGNPGNATSPDQDPTGGIGAGSTVDSRDTAATGQAPGVSSGENATSAGPGSGGGGGGGGNGAGGVGGMGMGDHGVGGSQGSENGQGGYRMGTPQTGDDGDMMMDEPVGDMLHENEAVLPRPMRADIGEDILAEAIGLYQDKGLTPRERKIALKDLLGEWAAQK